MAAADVNSRMPDMLDMPEHQRAASRGNSIDYEANSQGMSSKSLGGNKVAYGAAPATQARFLDHEDSAILNTDDRTHHSALGHKKSLSHSQHQYDAFNDMHSGSQYNQGQTRHLQSTSMAR